MLCTPSIDATTSNSDSLARKDRIVPRTTILLTGFNLLLMVGVLYSVASQPAVSLAEPPANAEKIDVDKLPKAVVQSVKKSLPGARITKAMTFVQEGKTLYFLDDVKVGKKAWELTMTETGTIIKKEECHDE